MIDECVSFLTRKICGLENTELTGERTDFLLCSSGAKKEKIKGEL